MWLRRLLTRMPPMAATPKTSQIVRLSTVSPKTMALLRCDATANCIGRSEAETRIRFCPIEYWYAEGLDASWNSHTPSTTPSFEIRKKMTSQQSKTVQKPGYREPRTPAEKRYWELLKPDYREWFERDALTLDQAAALAMGLDPQCVDFVMADENSTMRARFLATKNWFSRNEKEFDGRPLHLETIWVKANDNGDDNLKLPHFIEEALDLYQAKCLDVDRKIEALNDLIKNVEVLKELKKTWSTRRGRQS